MAINITAKPDSFAPAFSPNVYELDSTNKNQTGFKYLVDIFSAGTSSPVIAHYELWPGPDNGRTQVEVNKVLQTKTKKYFNPDLTGSTSMENITWEYDIYFGETYVFEWTYYDYYFYSSTGSTNGYVQLSSTTMDHEFVVGDLINVTQANTSGQSNVSGVQTVIEVPDSRSIIIGVVFTTSGPVVGGTITNYDSSRTYYSGLSSVTSYVVWNGAMSHKDFTTYEEVDWLVQTGTTGRFLTDVPNDYRVRTDSRMLLNTYSTGTSQVDLLAIETDDGGLFRINIPNNQVLTHGIGPWNLNNATLSQGSQPVISSNTTMYSAWTESATSARTSEVKTFTVRDYCTRYGTWELMFIDRKGSYISVPCEFQNTRSINIEKNQYQQYLGSIMSGKFNYNSTDRGMTNINIVEDELLTLNTGWLSEDDASFLRQLYTSPDVYLREDGESEFWPVIVTTNSLSIPRRYNKKLIQYSIELVYANRNPIQSF